MISGIGITGLRKPRWRAYSLHDVCVRDLIVAADLVDRVGRPLELEHGHEVVDDILDGNRLGERLDPPRRDNQRQMLDQRAHGLERGAARADDDRRTQLDGWYSRSAQGAADLVAACQVRREIVFATETSEVDDLPHPRESGDFGEVRRRAPVESLKVTSAAHRVDEVIGHLHAFEDRLERGTIQEIPFDDLGRRMNPTPHDFRSACQAAHGAARGFEATQEPTADVAGRAGKQDGLFGALCHMPRPKEPSAEVLLSDANRRFSSKALLR